MLISPTLPIHPGGTDKRVLEVCQCFYQMSTPSRSWFGWGGCPLPYSWLSLFLFRVAPFCLQKGGS